MGVDALRIDTVKHIERDNLLEYVNAWKAHKPGLFVFGENLVKGTAGATWAATTTRPRRSGRGGTPASANDPRNPNAGGDSGFSVLDFGLFSTFRDNVSRGQLRRHRRRCSHGTGSTATSTQLVTFLQNHDVGPDNDFRYRFRGDDWMAACAYNLLWTIRGIPCLYYGEEIDFMSGAPQDIIGNNDTLDSTGRAYFGDHLTDERLAETQAIRSTATSSGSTRSAGRSRRCRRRSWRNVSEWGCGMSFVRDYNDGESYAVVGLAMGSDQNITVGGVRNGHYVDAVSGGVNRRRRRHASRSSSAPTPPASGFSGGPAGLASRARGCVDEAVAATGARSGTSRA